MKHISISLLFLFLGTTHVKAQLMLEQQDQPLKVELMEKESVKSVEVLTHTLKYDSKQTSIVGFNRKGQSVYNKPCWNFTSCESVFNAQNKEDSIKYFQEINDSLVWIKTLAYGYDTLGNRSLVKTIYPDGGIEVQKFLSKVEIKGDTIFTKFYDHKDTNRLKYAYRSYPTDDKYLSRSDYIKYDKLKRIKEVKYEYSLFDKRGNEIENGAFRYSQSDWDEYLEANPKMAMQMYLDEGLRYTLKIPGKERKRYVERRTSYNKHGQPIKSTSYTTYGSEEEVRLFTYNSKKQIESYKEQYIFSATPKKEIRYTYNRQGLLIQKELFDGGSQEPYQRISYNYSFYED